jgi:hypothetical protein
MGIDGIDNLKNLENPKYVGRKPESYLKLESPHMEYQDELDTFLHRHAVNVANKLDEICREAIAGGKVTTYLRDGSMLMEVSPDVPFGEIHYHQDDSGPLPTTIYDSPIGEYDA